MPMKPFTWDLKPSSSGTPGRAIFRIHCARADGSPKSCNFPLSFNPQEQHGLWSWNGNYDKPTISPSIVCEAGCGRHFVVNEGNIIDCTQQ